jgi:hypothetical protein
MYGEHMLEYEQTRLRPVFEAEMRKLVPWWLEVRQQVVRQADFGRAVSWCDGPFTYARVKAWLRRTLAGLGEYQRLADVDVLGEEDD